MSANNTGNIIHIKSDFPNEIIITIANNDFNCCDTPKPGDIVGVFQPGGATVDLPFVKTSGHGCNGKQGTFDLNVSINNVVSVLQFNFDSDGNLGPVPDLPTIQVFLVQSPTDSTYSLTLSPPPAGA